MQINWKTESHRRVYLNLHLNDVENLMHVDLYSPTVEGFKKRVENELNIK
jgi:hypothetical protein